MENAAVFPPMNIDARPLTFEELALGNIPRKAFRQKFARRRISQDFAKRISEQLVASDV